MTGRRFTVGTLTAAIAGVTVVLGSFRAGRDSAPRPAMVYITRSGSRHHQEGRRYLRTGGWRMSRGRGRNGKNSDIRCVPDPLPCLAS